MKMNRLSWSLGLWLLGLGLMRSSTAWGQRDTVALQGQRFVFVTETVTDDENLQQQVHLLRLQNGQSKWLLRHTLLAESPDCNSLSVEVGGYAVTDTSIVFYTAWLHTSQAMAGICGVRKQVYQVSAKGRLVQGERLCRVEVGPQHPCLQGLAAGPSELLQAQPPQSAQSEWRAFRACLADELGATLVAGDAIAPLQHEVWMALRRAMEEARRRAPRDLHWVDCD